MRLTVRAQILLGLEAFVAVRALEFAFVAVYRQMALAVLLLDEALVADLALPMTYPGMKALMAFQAVLRAEELSACCTQERFVLWSLVCWWLQACGVWRMSLGFCRVHCRQVLDIPNQLCNFIARTYGMQLNGFVKQLETFCKFPVGAKNQGLAVDCVEVPRLRDQDRVEVAFCVMF